MAARLTPNSIAAINAGDLDLKPVVQVMEVTKITGSQERFQIVVSDGTTTQHALLATQLNQAARAGKVRRGSVVQLLEYICSTVQSRRGIRKRCKSEILTRKRPRKKRDGMPWFWCGENEVGEVNFSC